MESLNAVVDTNILIDYLNGSDDARRELEAFDAIYISLVSWMEVLVGAAEGEEEVEIREFLRRFSVHPVDEGIAERAVEIRRRNRIRLPDAIIWATAQHLGLLLVTRNSRDFPSNNPGVRIPYGG
ncbi:MAG TPA: type II toxin-antitoxin system VapC family toxin [Gemmatimonadaceae bacterium]|nr:type II toxin-antitoxin system VapC family toxin [Gemmatimonadaceae bacterium]